MEVNIQKIENKILILRNQQVMLDRDLAELYGVETKVLNQAVSRNIERFPERFRFQMSQDEFANWRSQFVTSNSDKMGLRRPPYVFTEQGVAMLSSVLKSETAVQVSIQIMDAFVQMRHFLQNNAAVFSELQFIRQQLLDTNIHQKETDNKIKELFHLMDKYKIEEKQGVFFQGQIFDPYAKFENIITNAENTIILIDNYVDLTILERLTHKKENIKVEIYTSKQAKLTQQDIEKFNQQYPLLTVHYTERMHDRFLIIDNTLYHIGASLKDLGKKCFAFEILHSKLIKTILQDLETSQ